MNEVVTCRENSESIYPLIWLWTGEWIRRERRAKRQGKRVNGLCDDEAYQELVVPGRNLAAEAEGILGRRLSDQVVRHVLQGCKIREREADAP